MWGQMIINYNYSLSVFKIVIPCGPFNCKHKNSQLSDRIVSNIMPERMAKKWGGMFN